MRKERLKGLLLLDDKFVGDVEIAGWENAWGFGEFSPAPEFETYSPRFAKWAQLMHSETGRLSEPVLRELRKTEKDLYNIRAKLYVPQMKQCRSLAIVNIDGRLIEWKEQWSAAADDEQVPAGLKEVIE